MVRDGLTGKESVTIARGVGERQRVVTRTRDASGREQHFEDVRGMGAVSQRVTHGVVE